ncbi:unnamed protein product [Cuscuta campestris]|uniref:Uncharacterized protein n=1 Tax=Cuscuta campestris TaxID=132261 RepID=A0A484KZ03_9ASTE|nr:unnamed protein product [Cuscuta campestris]
MTKTSQRFYLLPEEVDPYRTCKSKRFITKVMFLCVVGRPLIDDNGVVLLDGKIGIFHFTETVEAKRRSKNRAKGVLEVKPIKAVTKQVIKDMLINKVIPAIQEKWPRNLSKNIHIQKDNARPHIQGLDSEFVAAGNSNGFHITLVEELLEAVQGAYNALNPETLNKVWLSYQQVMTTIMEKGGNSYKLQNMGKGRLESSGTLPKSLHIDPEVVVNTARLLGEGNGSIPEDMIQFNPEEEDEYLFSDLN